MRQLFDPKRVLTLVAPLLLLVACSAPSSVTGVSVSVDRTDLLVGDQVVATATVSATGSAASTVTWSSSAPAVATVSAAGQVVALQPGTALITATSTFDATQHGDVTVTVTHPLAGRTALYYVDSTAWDDDGNPIDLVQSALDTAGAAHGLDVSSTDVEATFLTALGEQPDLVVVMLQGNYASDALADALVAHVEAGGYLAFATWDNGGGSESILAALGADRNGEQNLVAVSIDDGGLAAAFGAPTATLTNYNGNWGVFSQGLTARAGATVLATFTDGDPGAAAVVLGNDGRTAAIGFLADSLLDSGGDAAAFYEELFSRLMYDLARN